MQKFGLVALPVPRPSEILILQSLFVSVSTAGDRPALDLFEFDLFEFET